MSMLSLFRKTRNGQAKTALDGTIQHEGEANAHPSKTNAPEHPSEPYEYLPLEEGYYIRLLTILPSVHETDRIQCKLTVEYLTLAENHETLSYAWGPVHSDGSHLQATLHCGERIIRITKHLHQFLSRFRAYQRSSQTSRKIWIDAICINQHDDEEKAKQVQFMARIYRQAAQLNIWLGETDFDQHTLRLDGDRYATSLRDDRSRQNLEWIRRNVYFTRRWIVQELGLSPAATARLWLGSKQYHWSAIRRTIGLEVKNMDKDFIIYHRPEQELTLLENLGFCQYAECSEPRDLIFALLSISSDGN